MTVRLTAWQLKIVKDGYSRADKVAASGKTGACHCNSQSPCFASCFVQQPMKKNVSRQITIRETEYRKSLFFTHFTVEWINAHAAIRFYLFSGGTLHDHAGVFVPSTTLENLRKSLLEFGARLAAPDSTPPPTPYHAPFLPSVCEYPFADYIAMSTGSVHEIAFSQFSSTAFTRNFEKTAAETPLVADGILLLRCDENSLYHLIFSLYPTTAHGKA